MYREFEEYVCSNYDLLAPEVNRKFYHSKRVALLSKRIAENLKLNYHDCLLATQIGLLHDIARFYEWMEFESFNGKIFDHGFYGVYLLKHKNFINKFNVNEKDYQTVYNSIYYHNKYRLPASLSDNVFCNIIRDADKLDILNIFSKKILVEYEVSDDVSAQVSREFFNHKCIKNKHVRTNADNIISVLALIYDIKYVCSFKFILERKFLDKIFKQVKNKKEYKVYFDEINKYIKDTLKGIDSNVR